MICVICGGVGAARFLRALREVVDPADVVAIVNTGDDTVLHGLSISPDIDTIVYTLAGAIDSERGWGLSGETWTAMASLERYAAVRPHGSGAAPTWFNLGDRDLATHFYRTARLAEGGPLSDITDEIARAWNVPERLIPMTNSRVSTTLELVGGETVSFQEYFVKLRHGVAVRSVRFEGAEQATLHPDAARAIAEADTVVIAPSNPIVSIGPIRALAGVDELLASRRSSVVAVSPIIGGAALKGPADRMLTELGHESSVVGVARLYRAIAGALVIDPIDTESGDLVRAAGLEPIVVPSVMSSPEIGATLARAVLAASRS
ncbi:MAG: 2-phopspho-L-lactate transferase [Actinomycetota bacterium]